MKHLSMFGIAVAVLLSAPLGDRIVSAQQQPKATVQNIQSQRPVQLNLMAEKKVMQKDAQGKPKATWQAMRGKVTVFPGDVIRYTVRGANSGDRSVKNLVLTQPIPKQTTYILNSVTINHPGVAVTYSIDNGKSFVEKPIVKVKLADGKVKTEPAPAELYTHIRWKFDKAVDSSKLVGAAYQVKVK
ncbi:DUF11 domain-containing protein [Chroococcidiopsis sp. FACHB-1243]|uniref:DUF11 domain-containing protein n=1 Tax=Chroococcidiopsis sp. [FACHB-1243] TaxID=2692781 RepID=UPI00177F5743|nr:DUF11 domain-containing protein [Chroococcidiopsis sp. [FACHB-1243]]MBD2309409.1 DUF11 domain-containing protein [Chroococcidiopsis sp. [FACHB-1243]]